MRGNKTLLIVVIVIVLLLLVVVGGYFFLLQSSNGEGDPEGEETPIAEYVPSDFTEIVVSSQNIPMGMLINTEDFAVEVQPWPNDHLPRQYYTDLNEIDGKYARMDIPLGMPVMPSMLTTGGDTLNMPGSAASFFSPNNRVAYAIPMDTQGAVAWALKPGDRVDVIAGINMMSVDAEFQAPQPINFMALPRGGEADEEALEGPYITGRFENLPNDQSALIYATSTVSNIVVQLTVQDAIIWHIGLWEDVGLAPAPTVAPTTEEEEGGGGVGGIMGGAQPQAQATPVVFEEPYRDIEPITLLVTREDAMILKYLLEMGADLDFVLRPSGFQDLVIQPQPVWSRYLIDKYQYPESLGNLPIAPQPIRVPLTVLPNETPAPE